MGEVTPPDKTGTVENTASQITPGLLKTLLSQIRPELLGRLLGQIKLEPLEKSLGQLNTWLQEEKKDKDKQFIFIACTTNNNSITNYNVLPLLFISEVVLLPKKLSSLSFKSCAHIGINQLLLKKISSRIDLKTWK